MLKRGEATGIERGWFSTEAAANYLGLDAKTVTLAARTGRLRAVRSPRNDLSPSRRLKTCRAWCDEFMESMQDYAEGVS